MSEIEQLKATIDRITGRFEEFEKTVRAEAMAARVEIDRLQEQLDSARREARLSARIADWPVVDRICNRLYAEGGYENEPGKTVLAWNPADIVLYEEIIAGELAADAAGGE